MENRKEITEAAPKWNVALLMKMEDLSRTPCVTHKVSGFDTIKLVAHCCLGRSCRDKDLHSHSALMTLDSWFMPAISINKQHCIRPPGAVLIQVNPLPPRPAFHPHTDVWHLCEFSYKTAAPRSSSRATKKSGSWRTNIWRTTCPHANNILGTDRKELSLV